MTNFINLTPHAIVLNNGSCFEPNGSVARVSATFVEKEEYFFKQEFGEVINLPEPKENTYYIVSALVFAATDRKDVVAPATGHPACVRENGFIKSVPGFVAH